MYSLIARTLTRPGYRRQAALLLGSQPAQAQDVDNEFSLDSANDTPRGIWGNADTIWVVDSDKTIYAYNRSDGTRDASKDFGTLGAVGNDDPRGIWSDGTTMYVADWVLNKVFACKMSDTTHDSAKDITLDSSNDRPRGITGYGNTLWVIHDGVGGSNDKLYAYKLNPGQTDHGDRESSEEFNGIETPGNTAPEGIWGYAVNKFYVADQDDDKLYVYAQNAEIWSATMTVGTNPNNSDVLGYSSTSGTYSGDALDTKTFHISSTTHAVEIITLEEADQFSRRTLFLTVSPLADENDFFKIPLIVDGVAFLFALFEHATPLETTTFQWIGDEVDALSWAGAQNVNLQILGEHDDGFGYSRLGSSTNGDISDATVSFEEVQYTVVVVDDDFASAALCLDPAMPGRFTLGHGEGNVLDSQVVTPTTLTQCTRYEWADDGSPGWAKGEKVALAIIIPVNFPGSGLGITCAFQDGQTLSADTAGIDDPNGVGVITYKWKRVDCDDSNNDGNVGTDSPTYTVAATDLTCSIKFTVTYTDGDGFDEELSFTRSPRVSITGIEITSDPDESGPDDDTYIIGDTVAVTVTYSEDMTVSGLPELELNVGGSDRDAFYLSNRSTPTGLVFGYNVGEDDADTNGIAISANKLTLNNGSITAVSDSMNAALTHAALTDDGGHKVDGVRPEPSSAQVDGTSLTITFDENLDTDSVPVTGSFPVTVANRTNPSVSGVSISGATVTLTLNPAIRAGDTVTVSYTRPTTNRLKDKAGNDRTPSRPGR